MPSTNELYLRLLKDVNDIKTALRRTVANLPLYDIDNENTPVVLSASQNNYVPGNYDVLRLASTSAVNITGIAAGVKGRKLRIFNVGSYVITLVHQSGSSLAANRFAFVNSISFIIPPSGNVLLYYDATTLRWIGGDQTSLFDVVNEVTPAQITADQNNYDPGLAEVLRLSADINYRYITGISGGISGRYLQISNVGTKRIVLVYESSSSSASNRFYVPGGNDVVLYPNASVRIYYDGVTQRWRIPDAPSWRGTYGMSVYLRKSYQSIPDDTDTKITGFTVIQDDWGMYDATNSRIIVPSTGFYIGVFNADYATGVSTGYRSIRWMINSIMGPGIRVPGIDVGDDLSSSLARQVTPGEPIELYALQTCGTATNLFSIDVSISRIN